jgi:mandelate racemase
MPFAHLTLRSVEARAVLVPLKRPIVSKVGRYEAWPIILIDLHTEEGVVGRSYLEPYLERSVRYLVPAILDLAAAREGRPVVPLDDFRQGRSSLGLVGLEGMSLIAVSGLDMAAWDALAKAAGMPLAAFLGGSLAPVPAYNSNGLWLTAPERLGEEAAGLVAEGGFGALKLRLGRERLADDLAAIRAVRAAAGGEVRLMADFNQGLSLGDALRRCRELDDQGLYWLEEPIAYDDLAGYARLTRELATPVQLGENFYGPRAVLAALRAGAGDYVMPDLMRIGGVSGWLRAAALAGAAGIEVSSHLYPEFSAHLLRATETAHWLEWQDWADPILAEPFRPERGHLVIPDRPGAGLEWDEDAVRRYRRDL